MKKIVFSLLLTSAALQIYSSPDIACPQCGGNNIGQVKTTGEYICRDCGHTW